MAISAELEKNNSVSMAAFEIGMSIVLHVPDIVQIKPSKNKTITSRNKNEKT